LGAGFLSFPALRSGITLGVTLALIGLSVVAAPPTAANPISGNVSKTDQDPTIVLYFRAVIDNDINTKESFVGDAIEAHTAEEVKNGDLVIAPAGTKIIGHIDDLSAGKNVVSGMLSSGKHPRHGSLSIKLDKICLPGKKEVLISGWPVKQQSIFGSEGRFKEIDVDDDGIIQKASSLDMWGQPDFAWVMPESFVKMGRRLEVHLEEGDQLDFKAEVTLDELASAARRHSQLFQKELDPAPSKEESALMDAVPH
jgi:hypothetical protein